MPSRSASRGVWSVTGFPSHEIVPASGLQRPEMVLIMVDLPAPLSPIKAVTRPRGTSRSTPVRARTGPKVFEMPRSESSGPSLSGRGTALEAADGSSEMLIPVFSSLGGRARPIGSGGHHLPVYLCLPSSRQGLLDVLLRAGGGQADPAAAERALADLVRRD